MALAQVAQIGLSDRVYARAFAMTVRQETDDEAVAQLIQFADGDPHLLGRVRARFELLARERPGSRHAQAALTLTTQAWIAAIAET